MRRRTVREMISNEAGQKKFISPQAVFVDLLGVAGHIWSSTLLSRFLPAPRPEIAGILGVSHGVNTP